MRYALDWEEDQIPSSHEYYVKKILARYHYSLNSFKSLKFTWEHLKNSFMI